MCEAVDKCICGLCCVLTFRPQGDRVFQHVLRLDGWPQLSLVVWLWLRVGMKWQQAVE